MFAKSYGIIVLDLSGTQDVTVVRMGTVHFECIIAEPLTGGVALISLNQFPTYWEITPDGSIVLDLAPGTQIK